MKGAANSLLIPETSRDYPIGLTVSSTEFMLTMVMAIVGDL